MSSDRFYLDYNATSPLANSVKSYLTRGDFLFANPSSPHSSGKSARKQINQTKEFLQDFFSIKHPVLFHSGATESINLCIKGFAAKNKKIHFFYFLSDHAAVTGNVAWLKSRGHETTALKIDQNGNFDLDEVIQTIKKSTLPTLLNFTWVHNETGVEWKLETAAEIKRQTQCYVHVDAVQSVAKIKNYQKLLADLDFYTYSGHKFGSLKGVGFSFVKELEAFNPIFHGGGQQQGQRSGTENPMGVYTLQLALTERQSTYQYDENLKAKKQFEAQLKAVFGEAIEIVGEKGTRNSNTSNIIFKKHKADVLLTALDLAGIEVSSGSACSSGNLKRSETLLAMGYEQEADRGLRFSFAPDFHSSQVSDLINRVNISLKNFKN
ncbi:MAG: aminotransferase class V-fold PLP-dependent enzyme [Bacteriovoracaceae bacterium]|nr:aminotransferase class V-fold PLP-dependent enzyme [Bacteriovoracaceae bacterium]